MASAQPIVVSPSEGKVFTVGTLHIVSRIQGDQSNGAFELYSITLTPSTVDYHVHRTMDETICVVAGEIEFNVQGKKFLRPAGSVAYIPRGLHHGLSNLGPGPATVLVHFNPPRLQHEYFAALEKLLAAPTVDKAAVAALQKRYDQELIAPGT
jgi:quercetin dioxygenase-like cupin family protein